jgi:hypothetical protein
LVDEHRERGKLLSRAVIRTRLVWHLPIRLERIRRNVARAEANLIAPYRRARLLIAAGAVASWAGMWFEVLRPTQGKWAILVGRPIWTLTVVALGPSEPAVAILRLDGVANRVQVLRLPPGFPVIDADGVQPLGSAIVAAAGEADAVDRGGRAGRVQALVHEATNLEVDDFTIVPAQCLAEPLAGLVLGTPIRHEADTRPRATFPSLRACASVFMLGANSSLNFGGRLALTARLQRVATDRIASVDVATVEMGRGRTSNPTAGPEIRSVRQHPTSARRRREAWWP